MQITLEIPDDLAASAIPEGQEPTRTALEALALDGYRSMRLTESEVRRLLGFSTRMQVHQFLASHDVPLNYTMEHLEMDIRAANELHAQWLARTASSK
jgi:Uncharacterised protein family (UPF0175)